MKDFRTCMKGLHALVRPIRGRIALSVILGLVRVAASLTFVWLCKVLVDIACGQSDRPLGTFTLLLVLVMLVQLGARVAYNYWEGLIDVKTRREVRKSLFNSIMRSSWNGGDKFHSGDAVNRLQEDLRIVLDLLCSRLPDAIITSCQLLAASFFLLKLSPSLVWVLLVLMAVAVLGSKLYFGRLRRLTASIRAKDSEIQSYMQENLLHRPLVLTLFGADKVVDSLDGLQKEYTAFNVSRLGYNAVARAFMGFGFMGGYAAAFLWGVYGIHSGAVTFGMMTAFLQLVGQVQRPIADMSRHIPAFINSLTSVERLMEINELPREKDGPDDSFDTAPGIRVSGLGFTYPDGVRPVISGLSYDFRPGTTTVITGRTGAGKSTLVKIMLGLMDPSEGTVEIYDDTRSSTVSALTRCNFLYVPQGNSLMSGTIRENLLLADPDADEESMKRALHIAAADFVFSLPDGLNTPCREAGGGLSEGQAQRIAIARALLRKGGVLILDEASSALDSDTEIQLLDNLAEAFKGKKTIVFISHRDAVSRYADGSLQF